MTDRHVLRPAVGCYVDRGTSEMAHMIDWSSCPDVESIPGKVSGAFLIRGTRIPADAILVNGRAGMTAEQIAECVFEGLSVESARRVIAFADTRVEPMPG